MAKDYIGYDAMTDRALRSVVREALRHIHKHGFVASHHFYLTFKVTEPGVEMPDFLRQRYSDEMTIVLQNQFWDLKVGEDSFEVTLTFQKLPATLVVPYSALTAFVDPGVQFGLQFGNAAARPARPAQAKLGKSVPAQNTAPEAPQPDPPPGPARAARPVPEEPPVEDTSRIVHLDKFRKK